MKLRVLHRGSVCEFSGWLIRRRGSGLADP
jgi:hypothetical protein